MSLRVLDVFSCIGFHSIGLARAGAFEVAALCEANPRRRTELARLHPGVTIYDDIRSMPALSADIIFGGPPCQETSVAAAIHGKRSGASLWPDMLRVGAECEWIVVEQPTGNAGWEAQVIADLSRTGRHVARFEFGACDVGAPYIRRRVYILACTSLSRLEVAWQAGPSAIDCVKRAAASRGDWDASAIPAFDLDAWRTEDVHERRERIEALGDSNPPAMAEVIGRMLLAGIGDSSMTLCHLCGGERRVYSCWDEAKCPMAQDGGCDDCASRCPECAGTGTALPTRCDIEVLAVREGSRRAL